MDRELGPRQLRHLIGRCQLEPGYLWKRFEQLEEQRGEVQAKLDAHLPEGRERSLQQADLIAALVRERYAARC
ncbi:hypothetical protein M4D54_05515 [Brachybacterium sp. p3-SID1565]|uniref:Uncharacterized protein n=1 Tax=Brachybacterium epidermidis TaxID=2781983 RepID=A0ABR9VZ73_9MICO|nr:MULTISPECIES: hypothetical protein [Brachybacterium]MBE9403492.1 hypothetical protein [Brachybacterium epidermidis]MCT1385091.1 hypothetical protein [Brachybacterium sp. p3-SID1565]